MKKILITLILLFIGLVGNAQGVVTKLAGKIENNNPQSFWLKLGTEHPQMKAMRKAIKQDKPAMRIVYEGLGNLSPIRANAEIIASDNPNYLDVINFLYKITAIHDVYDNVEFFVVDDKEVNASMYPEGTCIINSGLIENSANVEEMVAVVAHEIAHFVLWHIVNDSWRTAKAIRRNQTWAEIGTGLAMGAYAASQINNAQNGVQQSTKSQQQMYNNIASAGIRIRDEIGLRTDIFTRLRYMRETESEADETAFWFLEKNGIDPINLINFLKRLDSNIPNNLKTDNEIKGSENVIIFSDPLILIGVNYQLGFYDLLNLIN